MDADRFDSLTTRLSHHLSRLQRVGVLAALGLGMTTLPASTDAMADSLGASAQLCRGEFRPSVHDVRPYGHNANTKATRQGQSLARTCTHHFSHRYRGR